MVQWEIIRCKLLWFMRKVFNVMIGVRRIRHGLLSFNVSPQRFTRSKGPLYLFVNYMKFKKSNYGFLSGLLHNKKLWNAATRVRQFVKAFNRCTWVRIYFILSLWENIKIRPTNRHAILSRWSQTQSSRIDAVRL